MLCVCVAVYLVYCIRVFVLDLCVLTKMLWCGCLSVFVWLCCLIWCWVFDLVLGLHLVLVDSGICCYFVVVYLFVVVICCFGLYWLGRCLVVCVRLLIGMWLVFVAVVMLYCCVGVVIWW